jgi:hypothetical protein
MRTFYTNGTHYDGADEAIDAYDADLDELYSWWHEDDHEETSPVATPAPAPALPEATFSLTLKGTLDGVDALLTVRGASVAEFQTNLQAVRGLLDRPAPQGPTQAPSPGQPLTPQQMNAAAMHRPVTGFCAVHSCQMHLNTGKDGRQWYSHRLPEGGFCKGK